MNLPHSSESGSGRITPADRVVLLLWLSLFCGLVTTAGLLVAKVGLHRFVHASPHIVWMAPVSYLAILTPVALLLSLAGIGVPWLTGPRGFTGIVGSLAGYGLALNAPGIHPLAAAVVGLGLGIQAARFAAGSPERFRRLTRLTLPVLFGVVALLTAAVVLQNRRLEQRRLGQLPAPDAGRPNVLLIVLDTQRAMSMSAYGYARPTTPNLERLAASGVRFDEAYSTAPWTLPSHASIMTGHWVHELSTDWSRPLDGTFPTLAEALDSLGYVTGGFTANVVNTSAESGIARGFTHYDDYPLFFSAILRSTNLGREITGSPRLLELFNRHSQFGRKAAPDVSSEFLAWLDHHEDRPFFAFLNYFDAHDPYPAPAPFDTLFGAPRNRERPDIAQLAWKVWTPEQVAVQRNAYEASIAFVDHQLGLLFEELQQRGRFDNTVVIVTADHGEEFYEHKLMRHGNSVYRASVNVPLILRYPPRLPAGTRVPEAVSLRDLPATVLDLAGAPDAARFPGRSLVDVLEDSSVASTQPVFIWLDGETTQPEWFPVHEGPLKSVLAGRLRYIVDRKGREELYQLNDTLEQHNLAADTAFAGAMASLREAAAGMARASTGSR